MITNKPVSFNGNSGSIYGNLSMIDIKVNDFFVDNYNTVKTNISLAESIIDKTWMTRENVINTNKLYFVTGGDGAWIADENERIYMKPGHIYFIPTMHKHYLGCSDEGLMRKYFSHCSFELPDGTDVFEDFGRIGELERPDLIENLHYFYKEDSVSLVAIQGTIMYALAELSKKYNFTHRFKNDRSEVIKKALVFINEHMSKQLSRENIAESCGVTVSTLSKRFSKEVGKSIPAYINELCLRRASQMLLFSDMPITEISDTLGFSDRFYFSKEFTKFYGVPPLKYRKNNNFNSK